MPILTLDNGCLAFGHVALLDRAEFQVDDGERIALIGQTFADVNAERLGDGGELTSGTESSESAAPARNSSRRQKAMA
mgnify:CR=1 FL=1